MVAQLGDPIPVALLVSSIFARLGIPYLIGGSVASTLHGEPRGTLDVDFAVHLAVERAGALADALEVEFFVDRLDVLEAAQHERMFNAIHQRSFVKADVHVRPRSGHSAEEIRRAREVQLSPEGSARVATPEDVFLRKLWWYRLGDEASDRQWRDAMGVLRARGDQLDLRYLRRWAEELQVTDLLERALHA